MFLNSAFVGLFVYLDTVTEKTLNNKNNVMLFIQYLCFQRPLTNAISQKLWTTGA